MQNKQENEKMLCVRFPSDLHHKLKLKALNEGLSLQALVLNLLKKALGK